MKKLTILALVICVCVSSSYPLAGAEPVTPLEISKTFGKVEEFYIPADFHSPAPLIIHIQSAHGNYEAEKNIQAILQDLTDRYGIDLLLLEGGAGKLDPGLFNFFPQRPDLNLKVADHLAKKAEMTGPELFLIERSGRNPDLSIHAHGIENPDAYGRNRRVFQKLLRQKEMTDSYLQEMQLQIERLTAPHVNAPLRRFLGVIEDFEAGKMNLPAFLRVLKLETNRRLQIDFDDPFYQKDWPMLIRLFRLTALEPELDHQRIKNEKEVFLKGLRAFRVDSELFRRIKQFLDEEEQHFQPRRIFEDLFGTLPKDFNLEDYPHLRLSVQWKILRSEIEENLLFQEIEQLQGKILNALIRTEIEKEIVSLFQDYFLLKKLFTLELSRRDYEKILKRGSNLMPSEVMGHFLELNQDGRIKNISLGHRPEIDRLYEMGLEFYRGADRRERVMSANAIAQMKNLQKPVAILVTGGFHSEGMGKYFKSKGCAYALITPHVTQFPKENLYHIAMLEARNAAFHISQITNALYLQTEAKWKRENVSPAYRRARIDQALNELSLNRDGRSRNRPTTARSDVRNTVHQLSGLKRAVISHPSLYANENLLKHVFETLKSGDPIIRKEALSTLSVLLWPSLEADAFKAHRKAVEAMIPSYRGDIEAALMGSMPFTKRIQEMQEPVSSASFVDLLPLEVHLYGSYGEKKMTKVSSNISELIDWIFQNKAGVGVERVQVSIPYDTGNLPSQFERGKFIELFLYLENITRPNFSYQKEIANPNDGPFFRHFSGQAGAYLSYLFQLSPGAVETPEALDEVNFRPHLYKRFREAQLLHLGLLLASLQESYRVFFPGENPSWMNERHLALAQAYRTFERRFISFLRSYNPYRDPNEIDRLQGPPEMQAALEKLHYEMQLSMLDTKDGGFLMEEVLYPHIFPWFYWYDYIPLSDNPWNKKILPRVRAMEAMALHSGESPTPADVGYVVTRGREFVEKSESIGDEYVIAMEAILSSKLFSFPKLHDDLVHLELSELYLDVFEEAGKFFDPFLDTKRYKEDTVYYIENAARAMSERHIALAHLAEPGKMTPDNLWKMLQILAPDRYSQVARTDVKRFGRSELRTGHYAALLTHKLKTIRILTNGLIGREDPDFEKLDKIVFRRQYAALNRHSFGVQMTSERIQQIAGESADSINALFLERFFMSKDKRFGVVAVPVPAEVSYGELRRVLREYKPILANHPKKVLVLTYEGNLSDHMLESLHQEFDRRVFVLKGNHIDVLNGLYSRVGELSAWNQSTQDWVVKHFLPRVSELNQAPVKTTQLGQYSFVVADQKYFDKLPIKVSKQFLEQYFPDLTPAELFRAHLLFALPYASLTEAELIKEIQENVPELEAIQEGDIVRLGFNANQTQSILTLVRAAQKILRAA